MLDETALYVGWWDGLAWRRLESSVDATAHTVSAQASSFGIFHLLQGVGDGLQGLLSGGSNALNTLISDGLPAYLDFQAYCVENAIGGAVALLARTQKDESLSALANTIAPSPLFPLWVLVTDEWPFDPSLGNAAAIGSYIFVRQRYLVENVARPRRLRAVLAHEVAHCRKHHALIKLLKAGISLNAILDLANGTAPEAREAVRRLYLDAQRDKAVNHATEFVADAQAVAWGPDPSNPAFSQREILRALACQLEEFGDQNSGESDTHPSPSARIRALLDLYGSLCAGNRPPTLRGVSFHVNGQQAPTPLPLYLRIGDNVNVLLDVDDDDPFAFVYITDKQLQQDFDPVEAIGRYSTELAPGGLAFQALRQGKATFSFSLTDGLHADAVVSQAFEIMVGDGPTTGSVGGVVRLRRSAPAIGTGRGRTGGLP